MITSLDIQLLAWFIAVIALAFSVYVLLLYIPQRANRWLSLNLFLLAINGYATGMMAGASTLDGARPGMLLSACIFPAIGPGLLLAALTLLKPAWLHGRWKPVQLFLQVLTFAPFLFVAVDVIFGTHLIHQGMPLNSYPGGIISVLHILNGPMGIVFYSINIIVTSTAACILLAYLAGFDKSLSPLTHRLAWWLCLAQVAITILLVLPTGALENGLAPLTGTMIYIVTYTYATYQLSTPERFIGNSIREVRGKQRRELAGIDRSSSIWSNGVFQGINSFHTKISLPTRLMILILSVSLPLIITVTAIIDQRMSQEIRQDADQRLQWGSQSVSQRVDGWLEASSQSLTQMALLPSIQNMDSERQKPVLQAMAIAHPDYLSINTVDLSGFNISRSDQGNLESYQDRTWFQEIKAGAGLAYQIAQDKYSTKPVIEIAVPIDNNQGILVGAGMLAIDPEVFVSQLRLPDLGSTSIWYVVDAQNKMIFNPNPGLTLRDYSQEPPVAQLRLNQSQGNLSGLTSFKDNAGQDWLASGLEMKNGWVVIVQQQKSEIYQGINRITQTVVITLLIATVLLLALLGLAIRHAIQPLRNLTETAGAIASGDLTRLAHMDRDDEIGLLGHAFNAIASQLRISNSELEKQIAERTLDLEVRSSYLQAAAEVSRIVASILDPDQLSQEVVNLIRERFGLFFVGLFQVDENNEWAVLIASTGKPGQTRVSPGLRIPIGSGMIGWSIANSQPRIVADTGADLGRQRQAVVATQAVDKSLSNDRVLDFPEVHSEAALPLRSRGQVIGALSLHSVIAGAFDKENITVFQILADQVAIAFENARLFTEGQQTLKTMQQIYGEMSRTAWEKLLHEQISVAYRADIQGVSEMDHQVSRTDGKEPVHLEAIELDENPDTPGKDGGQPSEPSESSLEIPIKVRGNIIGVLDTHKPAENPNWQAEEVAMVQTVADQLGLALESAQLYREAQYRAERERLIGAITTLMRESLDVDTVIQTAAREMLNALGLQDILIHLSGTDPQEDQTSQEPTGQRTYAS